jgi:phosphatidylinositol alpha-1,6-mannosyltransferase
MRLLLVSQDFPPETGGIQSYMGHLARRLQDQCEALTVVAPCSDKGDAAMDAGLAFPVRRIRVHSSWLVLPLLARLPGLVRRTRSTHVLYAQWFPALAGLRLPASVRQATVVHGRELLNHPLGAAGLRLAAPVLRRLDAVIPNSRHTAGLLPDSVLPDRVHVVHPGVDSELFAPPAPAAQDALRQRLGIARGTPVVTCLTRLVSRKGVDTLISAATHLRTRHAGVQVLVGGNGPDRPRLEALIAQADLGGTVRLLGRIPDADLPSFLSLGVFTLLSRQEARDVEGFGMVLAEAQACGAPVVAARSGGMPEAVGPGAGRIVPPDDPFAAAEALGALFDPVQAGSCRQAGLAHAATLDWPSRAKAIAQVLRGA